jgi:hypothetical protein
MMQHFHLTISTLLFKDACRETHPRPKLQLDRPFSKILPPEMHMIPPGMHMMIIPLLL